MKYKDCKVLNLCIYGSLEKYFDFDYLEEFNFIMPSKSMIFKEKYLTKIDNIASRFYDKSLKVKSKSEILSYRTFSKLSVADNLVDKFWVIQQIEKSKGDNIVIFLDDKQIYNIYSSRNNKWSFKNLLPYKQFFYFFIFLFRKFKSYNSKIITFNNDFTLYVGHKFEKSRERNITYQEYFFSTYWNNASNTFLLLNTGEWHVGMPKNERILLQESFLTILDLLNLLFISVRHFYFPIQVEENDIEDKLINFNLASDVKTSTFIDSFVNYYIFNKIFNFTRNFNGRIVIPHEGRSYEKIICTVFNKSEKNKVLGYAHFPVSEKILNYYYNNFDKKVYKNFSFFTLSQSNYDFFKNIYRWPENKFKIGPHLKLKMTNSPKLEYKNYEILLLLGNELVPNLKLLKFINSAIANNSFRVLVRLHPSTRGLKQLLKLINQFGFLKSYNKTLQEDAMACKIIVYGDTGASVDCLKLDLPLCYVMDDNCLISDRIHDDIFGHFRFFNLKEFRTKLPFILQIDGSISYESIFNKYISDLKPDNFIFE